MALSSPVATDLATDPLSAMQRTVDRLIEIVDRCGLHANGELLHSLEHLRKRTATRRITLAAFSDSRESKANLLRALLNVTAENASIPPSTVTCTYLVYGLTTECAVTLADSMTARLPLEQLAEFVNEKVPASNLKKVLVRFPNDALKNGLMIIDTPELSDGPEAPLSCMAEAVEDADACVLVMRAGEGLKENVIAFLHRMQGKLEKFFFILESPRRLSEEEQERSLELVRRSLEQRCGLAAPRVALLSSVFPGESDAKLWTKRAEACSSKLLKFARKSWQSVISNEVARVAGETLIQADGALNLREIAPLRRLRLRRVMKALGGISRQSADLALESDAALRALLEPSMPDAVASMPDAVASTPDAAASTPPDAAASPVRPSPAAAAPEPTLPPASHGPFPGAAPAVHRLHWQRTWEPSFTTSVPAASANAPATPAVPATIFSFPEEPFTAWVAPPTATPIAARALPWDQNSKHTMTPIPFESAQREQERPAAGPIPAIPRRAIPRIVGPSPMNQGRPRADTEIAIRQEAREEKFASDRPLPAEPAPRPLRWRAPRNPWTEISDDEEEFTRGDERSLVWRAAGIAALFAAVLTIAWAVIIILRPHLRQMGPARVAAALLAPLRSGKNASVLPIAAQSVPAQTVPAPVVRAQPAAAEPTAAKPATNDAGGAASGNDASAKLAETSPSSEMAETEKTSPESAAGIADQKNGISTPAVPLDNGRHGATPDYAESWQQDAALKSALDRWIEATRSGNVLAQAALYAPVVGTYFNSRNVTRGQVLADKERASTGTAGVQNYHITTIGISVLGDSQRAVLLQRDWDTPTGQGTGFAGTEIERLVFAQVQGEWKIVDEQEVKLAKLHRTRVSRRAAASF
jgi:hypothetical protein